MVGIGKLTGADAVALQQALGLSNRQFAERLRVDLSTVAEWRRRRASVELRHGTRDVVLAEMKRAGMSAVPVAAESLVTTTATSPWASDAAEAVGELTRRDFMMDRREAVQSLVGVVVGTALLEPLEQCLWYDAERSPAQRQTSLIGVDEVERLEGAARMFREWDDHFGGGLRRKAVIGQLSEVSDLLAACYPHEIERRLSWTMAQLAETAAMMSWDSGYQDIAQQYYITAFRAATRAGDRAFQSNVLAGMARQLLCLNVPGKTDQLAQTALDLVHDALDCSAAGPLSPKLLAMLYTREAWAFARLGRPTAFRRSCDKAAAALDMTPSDPEPYWLEYFGPAELTGTVGGRLLELAYRTPVVAAEAVDMIGRAIELRGPKRLRSSALDRLGMAEARFIEGEVEEACRIGHDALDVVEQTTSDRVRVKLAEVDAIAEHYADARDVAPLRDRIRPLVQAKG